MGRKRRKRGSNELFVHRSGEGEHQADDGEDAAAVDEKRSVPAVRDLKGRKKDAEGGRREGLKEGWGKGRE
jgi:hypothetical protein